MYELTNISARVIIRSKPIKLESSLLGSRAENLFWRSHLPKELESITKTDEYYFFFNAPGKGTVIRPGIRDFFSYTARTKHIAFYRFLLWSC